MSDLVLARRYAEALFELASEEKIADNLNRELIILQKMININPDWIKILDDVKIGDKTKRNLIIEVSEKAGFSKNIENLIKILAEKKSSFLWPLIIDAYKAKMLDQKDEVEATVTVADKKVWQALKSEISDAIKLISNKNPIVKTVVDPDILGGLTIKIGDTLYDGSIKGDLRRFERTLMEGTEEIFRR